jgi:hypothetical protein
MEAVLAEFKARVAAAKAEFRAHSKEERKKLRALRKATNEYVEKVTQEWRAERDLDKEPWWDSGVDLWDTRNPPSNIFQMEHANDLPYSQKRWLHM